MWPRIQFCFVYWQFLREATIFVYMIPFGCIGWIDHLRVSALCTCINYNPSRDYSVEELKEACQRFPLQGWEKWWAIEGDISKLDIKWDESFHVVSTRWSLEAGRRICKRIWWVEERAEWKDVQKEDGWEVADLAGNKGLHERAIEQGETQEAKKNILKKSEECNRQDNARSKWRNGILMYSGWSQCSTVSDGGIMAHIWGGNKT